MHQPNPSEIAAQAAFVQAEAEVGRGVLLPVGGWASGSKRYWTIVDPETAHEYADVKLRAVIAARTNYARLRGESFHRVLLSAERGQLVDHCNRNGLDNRRENLRFITWEANQWNRAKATGNHSSCYKGVSFRDGVWRALIYVDSRPVYLGCYTTEQAAAWAYDVAALELRGHEHALLNGIEGPGDGIRTKGRGAYNRLASGKRSEIVELARTVHNVAAIAKAVGVSNPTVRSYLAEAGVDVRQWKRSNGFSDSQKIEACELAIELGDVKEAALQVGASMASIYNWLNEYGIPLPGRRT